MTTALLLVHGDDGFGIDQALAAFAARLEVVERTEIAPERSPDEAAIEHDHIVTIYQVGEDRGVPFFAMQLLRGETLEERLNREKKLPVADVVRIGWEIAEGLDRDGVPTAQGGRCWHPATVRDVLRSAKRRAASTAARPDGVVFRLARDCSALSR